MNDEKGYTLTEAMMTVAIVSVLCAVAAPLLTNMTSFWRQTTARNDIERDVRICLDTVNRFARQAKRDTVVIDRGTNQPPLSRISFTSVQGEPISFYQTGNKLFMSKNGSLSVLSRNIAYIAFTYPRTDDTSIISVALTTQAPTYRGRSKALQLSVQKVRIMN